LPRAESPEAVVPTKFPLIVFRVAPFVMSTPLRRLPETRSPWGGRTITPAVGSLPADTVPPMKFCDAPCVRMMPFIALPSRRVPVASVPMLFMAIRLPEAP
jgi:hypothetical protein